MHHSQYINIRTITTQIVLLLLLLLFFLFVYIFVSLSIGMLDELLHGTNSKIDSLQTVHDLYTSMKADVILKLAKVLRWFTWIVHCFDAIVWSRSISRRNSMNFFTIYIWNACEELVQSKITERCCCNGNLGLLHYHFYLVFKYRKFDSIFFEFSWFFFNTYELVWMIRTAWGIIIHRIIRLL